MKNTKEPTFLCVGAMKAGTHTWYNMITQHSKVSKNKKELHFFNRDENYVKGKDFYISQFSQLNNDEIHRGEATPSYLTVEIAERIYSMFPNMKIIIILRNPVDRLISHYKMRKYIYNISQDIMTYVKEQPYLIENSLYYDAVNKYIELFGNNVKIIKFEDFINNPIATIKDSCIFLGIKFEYNITDNVDINESRSNSKFLSILKSVVFRIFGYKVSQKLNDLINYKLYDHAIKFKLINKNSKFSVDDSVKKELSSLFAEDILKLEKIINLDISDYKGC